MKIPKTYFVVRESIFNRKIHVFLNFTSSDFKKWNTKRGVEDDSHDDKDFMALSYELGSERSPTEWAISVKEFNWTIRDQGSLIHEIVHTIIKVWKLNNIPVNPDTQEFLAHSIGNLYEDIAAKLVKFRKIK